MLSTPGPSRRALPPSTPDNSAFAALWIDALAKYEALTGINISLRDQELARSVELCDSEHAVLGVLHDTASKVARFRAGDERWEKLRKALKPVVNVVLVFIDAAAEGAAAQGVVGGKAIFVAIGVLLKATQEVSARLDALNDLFDRMAYFLNRLNLRKGMPFREESRVILVDILVELLHILALATKKMRGNRFKEFADALVNKSKVNSALDRLDSLTNQELQVTVVENLSMTHQVSCVLEQVRKDVSALHDHSTSLRQEILALRANITPLQDAVAAQSSTITLATRELGASMHQGLLFLRQVLYHEVQGSRSSPTSHQFHSNTDVAFAQTVMSASRGDPLAALLCFALLTACSVKLSERQNMQMVALPLFMLGLWRAMLQVQRAIAPPVTYHASNTVQLIDILGVHVSLPLQLCASPEALHETLLLLFKTKKGASFVRRNQYELVKAGSASDTVVTSKIWRDVVICGAEIAMNVVVSRLQADLATSCPSCETRVDAGGLRDNAWIACPHCGTGFHITKGKALASGDRFREVDGEDDETRQASAATPGEILCPTQSEKAVFARRSRPATLEFAMDDLKFCRRVHLFLEQQVKIHNTLPLSPQSDEPVETVRFGELVRAAFPNTTSASSAVPLDQRNLRRWLIYSPSFLVTQSVASSPANFSSWCEGLRHLISLTLMLHARGELEFETISDAFQACSLCWTTARTVERLSSCQEVIRGQNARLRKLLDYNGSSYEGQLIHSSSHIE